jgi:hypothetical protein
VKRLAPLLLLAVAVAACGSSPIAPFAPQPTAECLRVQGFSVSTKESDVGFAAAASPQGGLIARTPGNTLVVAFGDTAADVPKIEAGFKRLAPRRIDMSSIMESKRNAVLLWTVSPTPTQLDKALGCLKS